MASWLHLAHDHGGWSVLDTGTLQRIVSDMSYPSTQYPSFLLFLGKANKTLALQALFPRNNITRRGPSAIVKVHISSTTASTEYPVLFAESDPDVSESAQARRRKEGARQPTKHRICMSDSRTSRDDIQGILYTRLLFPFTHILCIFADDFGEVDNVRTHLVNLAKLGANSTLPRPVRPRVVVVISKEVESEAIEQLLRLRPSDYHPLPEAAVFARCFSDLTVVDLRCRRGASSAVLYSPLKDKLLHEVHLARSSRIQKCLLFSATHLAAFFNRAVSHVSRTPNQSYDFISSSRKGNEVGDDFLSHLKAFLRLCQLNTLPGQAVNSFIASAIFMDCYPPGMHSFDPKIFFQRFYKRHCHRAIRSQLGKGSRERVKAIEEELASLHARHSEGESALQLRKIAVRPWAQLWSSLKTTSTCLFCLRRPPEHVINCGHAICETCTYIFGFPSRGAEYRFDIFDCVLCLEKFNLTVRLLPPTKHPSVILFDGGGIRGIVSLGFVLAYERALGLTYPVQDLFDLAIGTSAGALIVLELFITGMSVAKSVEKFREIAQQIFPKRQKSWFSISQLNQLVSLWIKDGCRDSLNLDETFKKVFGTDRRLFDVASPGPSGVKVALTCSRISDSSLCIFSNYNGVGSREERCGYRHLRAETAVNEPYIWEIARSCCAAPGYFRPKFVESFGPLQDGGTTANFPGKVARREAAAIWPSSARPDRIVSIGTGYSPSSASLEQPPSRGVLKDGFVPRLFRSLLFSPALDAERGYEHHLDGLDEDTRADYTRLNLPLADLPDLDDVERLDELLSYDYEIPEDAVRTALTTCFFLELDEEPIEKACDYECRGSILCSAADTYDTVRALDQKIPSARFGTHSCSTLGYVSESNGCKLCGYYRKRVVFDVRSLDEKISIVIFNHTLTHKISGFPESIRGILNKQKWDAKFGRPDHRTDLWPPARNCYCQKTETRKRRVKFIEPLAALKRQRL